MISQRGKDPVKLLRQALLLAIVSTVSDGVG